MTHHASFDSTAPVLGQPVPRREDERLLTGRGRFVDDLKLPGMVHMAVLRSPVGHARIRSIDKTAARAAPGVLAVISAEDVEGYAHHMPVSDTWVMPGYNRFLQWPIAKDFVRFVGEPIVAVVAETRSLAEDACGLVEIDFEVLDAVTNIDEALTDKVVLHESVGTNLACHYVVGRGDADQAFQNPHYTRKEVFRVHRHTGMALETRGYVAQWDPVAGKMTCWGANKRPWQTRDTLASMLKLNREDVTLIENDTGGNFGTRGHFYPENLMVAFLAMRLGRPVKFIEDRRENMMATNHSRELSAELEIAVNQDGKIAGLRARVFCDLGAYATGGGSAVPPAKTVQFIPGPYKIDNYKCELSVLVTCKTPVGAFRGPGRYEAGFFIERLLDIVAKDLGLDPIEFRKNNLIRAEDMPYNGGVLVPYLGESPYDTGDYLETFERALKLFDYDALKAKSGKMIDGKLHGVAASAYVDSTGMGPSEEARIVVKSPKQIELFVGTSANGQGVETTMAQVAANQLGVPYDLIQVFAGSTNYVANGNGHGHSRAAVQGGSAVFIAVNNLIKQLLDAAALRFNEPAEHLEYRNGAVFRKKEQVPLATFDELVRVVATDLGREDLLQAAGKYVNSALTYSYGAQVAHVTVDPETAVVEVERFLTVEDVGRALNPLIVHGQSIGAAVQGLSGTFLDEFVYDASGQLLTGSFADYLVATSTDFPSVEAETLQNAPAKSNPLGAKGAGEGAISTTGAVLANAVSNALSSLNVQVYDLPISPNNLSRLIRQAKAGGSNRPETGAGAKFGIRHDSV
ncbi:xanthine dehydrogenase family protein molybdopterin-binding subunit [Peristeroidobacter soli]|uniref:xanthine dehydrogenase family protein molybdopterin-binding subunit n=1 Tax=Peristeroidobacter soli TaxID=2497877 RepID=UPI00101B6DF8|nr:xanthine dehydrogenase family protein molybdopterin-binding subunit [Peristeroidobacter soli]